MRSRIVRNLRGDLSAARPLWQTQSKTLSKHHLSAARPLWETQSKTLSKHEQIVLTCEQGASLRKDECRRISRRHPQIEPACAKLTSQSRPRFKESESNSHSHLEQPRAKLIIYFSMFCRMTLDESCPFNAERPALSQNIFFQKVHRLLRVQH